MEFDDQLISVAAYDVLWEFVMAGVPKPAVLWCDMPGDTAAERVRVVNAAMGELHRAGYSAPRCLSDEVRATLETVARPRLAIDVRLFERVATDGRGRPVVARWGARVAVRGSRGVVAVLGPHGFTAKPFPHTSMINEAVRLFPPHDAPGRFTNGVNLFPDQLVADRLPRRLSGSVRAALEGPFQRRAHVCAIATGQFAADRVSPGLTVNDTTARRFLVFMAASQLAIVPGNRATLERKLKELAEPSHPY
jgi:EspG family